MDSDIDLLRRLGGLHGARIEEAVWRKADQSVRLRVADMFSNSVGLPDYRGPAPGTVTFVGLDRVAIETALFRGVFTISGIDVEKRGERLEARIGLSEPGADLRLLCRDVQVTIEET
jgi:hypothetical protein